MIRCQPAQRLTVSRLLAVFAAIACGGSETGEVGWRPLPALEAQGWLVSTTASPDGSTWLALGGSPDTGKIVRSADTASWTVEQTPAVPLLNWGQVFADGSSVVVGNGGTILRYAAGVWTREEAPTREDLWGVWGARPDDLWAVGGAGQREGQATLLHYDGSVWRAVVLPPLERPNVWALFKVWGSAADDVYAVGQRGAVLHYDGRSWSELGLGTGDDLIAVYGVARDRVAIVGGRSSGFVATFDGARWSSRSLAPLPGLNGVWMGERETIHVAGIEGTLAEVDFATLAARPAYQETGLTFHALHGAGARLLAVGGNLDATAPPWLGLARARTTETP